MALRNFAVSVGGAVVETANSAAALIAAADTAVDDAVTANGVAGAKADVTTELGLAIDAIAAISTDIPSGALVVALDTAQVTTVNQLRALLDTFVNRIEGSSLLPAA